MRSHLPRGGDGEWKQKGGWVLLGSVCFRLAWVGQSQAGPGQWLAHITGILAPAFYRRLFSLYLWMFLCMCVCASVVRKSICVCVCCCCCCCVFNICLLLTALQFSLWLCFLLLLLLFPFFPPLLQPFSLIFICFSFNLFCHFVFLSAVIVVVAIFIAFITNTHKHTQIHRYLYIYTLTHVASSNIVCPSQPQCVSLSSLPVDVCVCECVYLCVSLFVCC